MVYQSAVDGKMLAAVLLFATFVVCVECTHIFTIEKDFNKLHEDKELGKYVGAVLQRLEGFKAAVHPRIRLFYKLLKRAMAGYAQRTADTLYNPSTYRRESDNVA